MASKVTAAKSHSSNDGNHSHGPSKKEKKHAHSAMKSAQNFYYIAAAVFIAIGCGCFNSYHVSTVFENDRHFSHLSTMEREMGFVSEAGFYYSYYKTIVEAPTFLDGLVRVMHDNLTEYPDTINALKRFNLYPEVVLSGFYRMYIAFTDYFGITNKLCWQVDRGSHLSPVWSCEGLGDLTYFYLAGVWLCGGVAMSLVYLYGLFLSNSFIGGAVSVLCFFYNHGEATRIQWTPPLRENFGYPFCLAQMLYVSYCLRQQSMSVKQGLILSVLTALSLLPWQFTQFVLLTQILCLYVMYIFCVIKRELFLPIAVSVLFGLEHGVLLLFGNEMLAASYVTCFLISMLLTISLCGSLFAQFPWWKQGILQALSISVLTGTMKMALCAWCDINDDAHISNILLSKLTSFRNFHTMLYTCSDVFGYMTWETPYKLTLTLLLPCALVVVTVFALYGSDMIPFKTSTEEGSAKKKSKESSKNWDAAIVYNILQLLAFAVMAILIMRLKLFFVPHLCLITALLASHKYFSFMKSQTHWTLLAVIIAVMSVQGVQNISQQRSVLGEYSNVALEELLEWIKSETSQYSVFAGPMPLMANVLLTTRRPIVIHPHYEDAGLRERTKKVYSLYSRRPPEVVYGILLDMHVDYVILDWPHCSAKLSEQNCGTVQIWDIEEAENRNRPPLCPTLYDHNAAPFEKVFSNNNYVVLWLPTQYVELKTPKQYKQ